MGLCKYYIFLAEYHSEILYLPLGYLWQLFQSQNLVYCFWYQTVTLERNWGEIQKWASSEPSLRCKSIEMTPSCNCSPTHVTTTHCPWRYCIETLEILSFQSYFFCFLCFFSFSVLKHLFSNKEIRFSPSLIFISNL